MAVPTILDYYKYSALATAVYVRVGGASLDGATFAGLASSAAQHRIPLSLANRLFVQSDAPPTRTYAAVASAEYL